MDTETRVNTTVNNAVYEELGDRWYTADDDPIALLRAESRLRNPWVRERIESVLGTSPTGPRKILDVGCGGGFLSNDLAQAGYRVTGIDLSASSLEVARRHNVTSVVTYQVADALHLPFEDGSFDVVCAMDFLEHVESPGAVIAEAARVLAPGGLFFFHTFNRTLASRLLVIRGVEWFIRNVPPNLHVYRLFIKPEELRAYCLASGLKPQELTGMKPRLFSVDALRALVRGRVPQDFRFEFTSSLRTGYVGYAYRLSPLQ